MSFHEQIDYACYNLSYFCHNISFYSASCLLSRKRSTHNHTARLKSLRTNNNSNISKLSHILNGEADSK
jgi:hypothetical protein